MIYGSVSLPRVIEESTCKSSQDYTFSDVGIYKIWSAALMPNIPFEEAAIVDKSIDKSIFINDDETMPTFNRTIKCQNFLSTQYVGRAPLEWYSGGKKTKAGREFLLICRNGNPNAENRVFGTEAAIHGYNRNASENVKLPEAGDE